MTRRRPSPRSRSITGMIGGCLLAFCVLWLGWILLFPQNGTSPPSPATLFALFPTPTANIQVPQLLAQGIILSLVDQKPVLSQQQALLIANSLKPEAASKAKKTSVQHVLLKESTNGTPALHPELNNAVVWLISYEQIPLVAADPSVDSDASPSGVHNLYVFLDATTGKELLSLWT